MKGNNLLSGIIDNLGPLDDQSMKLIILAAVVASKPDEEIYEQVEDCIKTGISEACIYHTIMGLSGIIGINKTLSSLKAAEMVLRHASSPALMG